MLELNNVNIFINNKKLLKDVSFTIKSGDIIRLVGENGSGKTTLVESILGLRSDYTGSISKTFSLEEYGYLPQVASKYPKIYFEFEDLCNKEFSFYPTRMFKKNWHTSSGGEVKKVLIAKAFTEGKKIIILDEPFNHLDKKSCELVSEEVLKLSQKGISVLYIGHDYKIPTTVDIEVDQWRF